MKRRVTGVLAFAFALALVASACSSKSSNTTSPTGAPTSTATSGEGCGTLTVDGLTLNDHGTKDVSGGGSVKVEVDSFYFNPTVFTGHAGDKLTLQLSNESSVPHNFSLTDQSVDQDIQPGGKVTVTVTFPQSGSVVFFCKFHQASGMRGALEVE